jgi:nicotinic acid mononucleotide adenylyltransferase
MALKSRFRAFWILLIIVVSVTAFGGVLPAGMNPAFKPGELIGIGPGTFDPIHRGHQQLVADAILRLKLTSYIVVPNYNNEKKPNALPFRIRRLLTTAAFRGMRQVVVADENFAREVNKIGLVEEIHRLARAFPEQTIVEIMGSDTLENFRKHGITFEKNVIIAVSPRDPDYEAPKLVNGIRVVDLGFSSLQISSTLVRDRLSKGDPSAVELLDPAVYELIGELKLYRSRCDDFLAAIH